MSTSLQGERVGARDAHLVERARAGQRSAPLELLFDALPGRSTKNTLCRSVSVEAEDTFLAEHGLEQVQMTCQVLGRLEPQRHDLAARITDRTAHRQQVTL